MWIAVVAALLPSAALGGAWTLQQGNGQVVVTDTASQANTAFDSSGRPQSTPRYTKEELQVLMEYGVTDWLTAIVAPELQSVSIAAPVEARRAGLGYTEFGGRVRVLQGTDWVLSGQTTVRLPGTFDNGNPAAIGYTGVEVDVRGLFGIAFDVFGMPAFADVQVAQRFRAGDPPDEARVDLTFGLRTARQWMVLAQSFNVISEGAGSSALFSSYNYHKLQFSGIYELNRQWALQAGLFTTVAGRNALQENGLVLAAWYRY